MRQARLRERKRVSENAFAYTLLAPALFILIVFIGYPMIYNIVVSTQKVPLNAKLKSTFIGLANYKSLLTDKVFYQSLGVTIGFTIVVVLFSTLIGLGLSVWLHRDFKGKRIVHTIIILSYAIPAVCLIFAWKYMFNQIYGIVNYFLVDVLGLFEKAPLWFDQPKIAFVIVSLFSIWKNFPYAFISFTAVLQTIDQTLYEAAEMDGANSWAKFKAITFPALKPTVATVVSLRILWVFNSYANVVLLSKQVNVVGVYLYNTAFSTHDLGKAAAISILLFVITFGAIILIRKKVLRPDED